MKEILSNLVAEQQLLDQYLQSIPVRNWNTKTKFKNWTITDHVSYLAGLEDLAFNAIKKKGSDFSIYKGSKGLEKFENDCKDKGKNMRPQDVIEWWRLSRARVVETLADATGGRKLKWWKEEIDYLTFASTKLAETWAHGLDIYACMNKDYEDTIRIEHIALYGWLNAESTSKQNKIKFKDLRLELIGPEYRAWQFGNENSENIIKGNASDWCRIVTGRTESNSKSNLNTEGDFAKKFLKFKHIKL